MQKYQKRYMIHIWKTKSEIDSDKKLLDSTELLEPLAVEEKTKVIK